jgi:hypothetical protein
MANLQKIFFQTKESPPVARTMVPNLPMTYVWSSLEVPDPRFNYKASNWLRVEEQNAITPKMSTVTQSLLGKDGRDGDFYMSVSDAGKLQSPGELGFLVRPFNYRLTGASVDFRTRTAIDPNVDDSDAFFRTVRLYDHGDPSGSKKIDCAQDLIYENFTAQNRDGTVAGARVNPLSDIPLVLAGAVDGTPSDYWVASLDAGQEGTIIRRNTFNQLLGNTDWSKFTNAWSRCLINAKQTTAKAMNTSWKVGLPDVYGNWNEFGWYSEGDQTKIFNPPSFSVGNVVPASLGQPLYEIDRKMLYSFSLESFSDRQQLFLYILRAEVTVPSFGSSQEGETRSLAGGRAVALVWRDPYPLGYDKESDTFTSGNWYFTNDRVSPWYQVNKKQYNDDFEPYNQNPLDSRLKGYHESGLLFFKQLGN